MLMPVLGRIGVEHGGNVVLGMAGGEQHAGDGEDLVDALPRRAGRGRRG